MSEPEIVPKTSSGVSELIERLRSEGVEAGRARAREIVAEAERQAEEILSQARGKSEAVVAEARSEAERLRAAGEDALKIASRDTVIEMRETFRKQLEERTRRLLSEQLENREVIEKIILEVVSRACGDAGLAGAQEIEILLPLEVLGLEELRDRPEELRGKLSQLVKQITSASLREGISFRALDPGARGIRVILGEQGIEVDLTDRAVAEMILRHLQPRFRALMEGILR